MTEDLYDDMNGSVDELAHPKEVKVEATEPGEALHRAYEVYILAECLCIAREAYTQAKENPSSEDIRALAITLFIDKGKDKRVASFAGKKTVATPKTDGTTAPAGDKPKAAFAEEVCPACGGKLYDNRENKLNPKGPDYKCANKECGKAGWIRTNGKTGVQFTSWSK